MKTKLLSVLVFAILIDTAYGATVIPFSSPENSYGVVMEYLNSLNKSAYLSGYTFTSQVISDGLIEAKLRGVDIKILLENGPVGGVSNYSLTLLCNLYAYNIPVYFYKGDLRFLHAKYIIGDNSSILVSSENFGDHGYSKTNIGNRGWGSLAFDWNATNKLLGIFFNDLEKSEKFSCSDDKKPIKQENSRKAEYKIYYNQTVDVVISPDNSIAKILELLQSAEKSIYIEQLYIRNYWGEENNPFLELVIQRARDGIEVKVLLDSSEEDGNAETADYINKISEFENLNMEAKLADLDILGFEMVHTKGVIVDGNRVLVSSINWNENSPKNNREIGVIVDGDAAKYFYDLFLKDWGSSEHTTTGKIIEESKNQIIYIVIFIFILSGAYYFVKHRPKKSKTFLS